MADSYACIYPSGYTLSTAEAAKYAAGHRYTSASAWEAGEQANLVTSTTHHYCEILAGDVSHPWAGHPDTNALTIGGWTTNATYFITMTTLSGARHNLTRNSGYEIQINDEWVTTVNDTQANTHFIGISISNLKSTGNTAFKSNVDGTILDSCLIYGTNDGITTTSGTGMVVVNTTVYSCAGCGIMSDGSEGYYAYNDVIINCGTGIYATNYRTTLVKNCYAGGCTTAGYYLDGIYGAMTFTTSFSSDGSRSTTVVALSTSAGTYFTNVTAGSENCTKKTGSSLIEAGTDLHADATYPFTWDYTGTTRAGTWDCGPDEYASSATVYTADISETGSASDNDTGRVVFLATNTEVGSALDIESGIVTFLASITETGTVLDTSSGKVTFLAGVTETGTVLDTESATITFLASISETSVAIDTESAIIEFLASITEEGIAIAIQSDQDYARVYTASIIETASAVVGGGSGGFSILGG